MSSTCPCWKACQGQWSPWDLQQQQQQAQTAHTTLLAAAKQQAMAATSTSSSWCSHSSKRPSSQVLQAGAAQGRVWMLHTSVCLGAQQQGLRLVWLGGCTILGCSRGSTTLHWQQHPGSTTQTLRRCS